MPDMSITLEGEETALKTIKLTEDNLKDFRGAWPTVQITLQQIFMRRFENPEKWLALNPITNLIAKQKHKPLVDSGMLKGSLGLSNGKWRFRRKYKTRFHFGTRVKYARAQNYGATIPVTPKMWGWFKHQGVTLSPFKKNINVPARKFFYLNNKDLKQIEKTVDWYINDVTKEAKKNAETD